jgi:hypothetical protein
MMILRETAILALLCLADLMLTIWLVATGKAIEGNPLLRFYLSHGGLTCFTAAKIVLFAGPLMGLEILRHRRPVFTRSLMRAAIVIYLFAYAVGVLHMNRGMIRHAARLIASAHPLPRVSLPL